MAMSHCVVKLSTTGQKIAIPPGHLLMADSGGIYNIVATDMDILNTKYGVEKTLRLLHGKQKKEFVSVTVLGLGNSAKELQPLLVDSTPGRGKRVRAPKRKNFTPSVVTLKGLPKKAMRESEKSVTAADKKALNAAKRQVVLLADEEVCKKALLRQKPQNMNLRTSEGSYGRSPSFQEEVETPNEFDVTNMNCDFEERTLYQKKVQIPLDSSSLADTASSSTQNEISEEDSEKGEDSFGLIPENTPNVRVKLKPRTLSVPVDPSPPDSVDSSLPMKRHELSAHSPNSEFDSVKIKEEVSFYKKLADSRFVEIIELRTDLANVQEECAKLRQQVATFTAEPNKALNKADGFEKHLAVLEKNLKEHIDKTSENGDKSKVGLSRSKKGMVNISPTIEMTAKAYISARNASDIWKRINWVVAGYWTVEERMKLYFKVPKDEDPAGKREITDKEIADIIFICSTLEKENPLEEHEDDDDAEKSEEKAEEFKSELIRAISRKLIVDRSRSKNQNREKNSVSKRNGKRNREAKNLEEEDPKDDTSELETGNEVTHETEKQSGGEDESDKENATQQSGYSVIASYDLPVISPP